MLVLSLEMLAVPSSIYIAFKVKMDKNRIKIEKWSWGNLNKTAKYARQIENMKLIYISIS